MTRMAFNDRQKHVRSFAISTQRRDLMHWWVILVMRDVSCIDYRITPGFSNVSSPDLHHVGSSIDLPCAGR